MSKTFTVYKSEYNDGSVLVSDGTKQVGFYVKEGVQTLEEFLNAIDVSTWSEDVLSIFKTELFQNVSGTELGTFEVPYIKTT